MYCLWARAEQAGTPDAWARAEQALRRWAPDAGLPAGEIELVLDPVNATKVQGTGYVVDALWSARHAVYVASDYASVVRCAISLGNDTDTTAAIAGGIAGIRFGLDGIPGPWREALRGRDVLEALLTQAGV